MKKGTLFWILFFMGIQLNGQISTQEMPYGLQYNLVTRDYPGEILLQADKNKISSMAIDKDNLPMLAGVSLPVEEIFADKAIMVAKHETQSVWQLKISVPQTALLGLVFSNFQMPPNDKLFIYNEKGDHFIGAFTHKNNSPHGLFSTTVIPGSTIIIEYVTNTKSTQQLPGFVIDELIYLPGERFSCDKMDKTSGSCNVNVNCPEGDLWQKQKRGVTRILLRAGSTWFNCSGTLVNNTHQDGTPYLLTSDHCGSTASEEDYQVWQFYFNYEHPQCFDNGDAPLDMMLTGSTLLASAPIDDGTDFKLLELDQAPPDTWNPYYNGWNKLSRTPGSGTSIHHPSGDVKKISTYKSELTSSTFSGGMQSGYWRVVWDETVSGHGVTEGGSSGSPIFDEYGLITGTLTGGSASCSNTQLPDFYGKFYRHWQSNGDLDTQQLQPWLDPDGDGPERLYGYDPNATTNFVHTGVEPPFSGSVSGGGYYAHGEPVILNATPNDGFEFDSWALPDQENSLRSQKHFEFTMPDHEVFVQANFKQLTNITTPQKQDYELSIYPNPATHLLHITLKHHPGKISFTLIDLLGRPALKKEKYMDQQGYFSQQFDLSNVESGLYLLKIRLENEILTRKIIIDP